MPKRATRSPAARRPAPPPQRSANQSAASRLRIARATGPLIKRRSWSAARNGRDVAHSTSRDNGQLWKARSQRARRDREATRPQDAGPVECRHRSRGCLVPSCLIRDISNGGAQLEVQSVLGDSAGFTLRETSGRQWQVLVVQRRARTLGGEVISGPHDQNGLIEVCRGRRGARRARSARGAEARRLRRHRKDPGENLSSRRPRPVRPRRAASTSGIGACFDQR